MFKFLKKIPAPKLETATKENFDANAGLDYEASFRYLIEVSNRRAYFIAGVSVIVAILAILAVVMLTPLKQVEPYVIRVDNISGAVDIITVLDKEQISSNEAMDKYFIAQYVKKREGYFFNLLTQDYVQTQLYSSPQVAAEYRKIYEGKNSRDQVLGNKYEVDVKIISVALGTSAGIKTASVRANIIHNSISQQGATNAGITTKIITLSYDYFLDSEAMEDARLLNPLGFKVLSYRVDDETQRQN